MKPGHRHPVRRALIWGLVAAVGVPWVIGEWFKSGLQPGLTDRAASASALVDYVVLGSIFTTVSIWFVVAFALGIVRVMKGPRYDADAFPPDAPRPGREP